ncbi:predicted protein [Sclerotinia sclerotiorum 1980 UF-70]|uniref:Uncharacterized protein n=1 Tax=Sclerotinia sclerotiorum (strain ATCC 18683 / 1980 / Ss-1) TaxID=665079 RepID=A7EF52_SCLS1|nr:predicted protein [Sclerotinia sclerotiorum 1980 UF-70]EDO01468.1 predicted protein [Sclerotinia sclerotiorum 1980 UF-70]
MIRRQKELVGGSEWQWKMQSEVTAPENPFVDIPIFRTSRRLLAAFVFRGCSFNSAKTTSYATLWPILDTDT